MEPYSAEALQNLRGSWYGGYRGVASAKGTRAIACEGGALAMGRGVARGRMGARPGVAHGGLIWKTILQWGIEPE